MFPTSSSTPSSAALAGYLPTVYNIADNGGRLECYFVTRAWSDVYLVRVYRPGSEEPLQYYLKIYAAGWRTEADIAYEMDLVTHLHNRGIGVAPPVTGRDGSLLQSLKLPEGRRFFTLSQAARGAPLSAQPLDVQSGCMGRLTAQLHTASQGFRSTHRRAALELDRLLALSPLKAFAEGRESELARLEDAADRVRAALEAIPLPGLPVGVCHGDLGPQNVFLDGGSEATIIDFDDCAPGWLAFDLGHAFMFFYLFHAAAADQLWQIYLDAYRSVRELTEIEIAAAPAFALALFLKVHGHDNPIGAARDRWDASWYVSGAPWSWMLNAAETLSKQVGKPPQHRVTP